MKVTNNTVLITGGGSGIGYETAKLFSDEGNKVIICGRNAGKLKEAASKLKNVTAITCDITNEEDINRLVQQLTTEFKELNILINNAGAAHQYLFSENTDAYTKATEEITTNYLATVRLTEKLLPLLRKQPEASIINITSIVAFAPGVILPTYSASKAALHSYTQSLRLTLHQSSNIKVFEVMPPIVDTEFSKDLPGENCMQASEVAGEILKGLSNNTFEIRVGFTETFYGLYLQSPEKALYAMNRINQ